MPSRRMILAALVAARGGALNAAPTTGAPAADVATLASLRFPRDFGAHPEARTEWWYVTGALAAGERVWGFQITFFRAATAVAGAEASRFAARQLLFAHGAVTDLAADGCATTSASRAAASKSRGRARRHRVRPARLAPCALGRNGRKPLHGARNVRQRRLRATTSMLAATQPVLPQGSQGLSRKGPLPEQASYYYSQPQLAVAGALSLQGRRFEVTGKAWLDHEWSQEVLDSQAVGWDWIGMNLEDGSALTAFRLRRQDGSSLWDGGSFRTSGGALHIFSPGEVVFSAQRRWTSQLSQATYPVEWIVRTPADFYTVRAVIDDQELDSRPSTGAIYWEGLSELIDSNGKRVGRGYLEMTGYAKRLRL